jgi:hypothetical protein
VLLPFRGIDLVNYITIPTLTDNSAGAVVWFLLFCPHTGREADGIVLNRKGNDPENQIEERLGSCLMQIKQG